jgi:hypothetical protein
MLFILFKYPNFGWNSDLYSFMRNTTKLKQILLKYDLALSMEEENLLKLTLVDKNTGSFTSFEHSSYSQLLSKCYSFFLKELKRETVKVER